MATAAPATLGDRTAWLSDGRGRFVLRAIVVAAQISTIMLTWPLWQVRTTPPLLPALPLPQLGLGAVLVVASLVLLFLPRFGWWLYAATLGYAMLLDQTRMQPQMFSLLLLAAGTLPGEQGRLIARTHLMALWTYAGLHKLFSGGYYTEVAPWLCQDVLPELPARVLFGLALAAALYEIVLGLGSLWPRARWCVVAGACLLHGGVLLALSPLGHNWNSSVWPWNAAIMAAAIVLIGPWQSSFVADFRQAHWPARSVVLLLAFSPLGYYFGLVDAYLAHCLYSGNVPKATRYDADGSSAILDTWETLNVPLPPEPRLFEQYFRAVAGPGEKVEIKDPRAYMRWRGREHIIIETPPDPAENELPRVYVLPDP